MILFQTEREESKMQIRLYFDIFNSRQLITGSHSAYAGEIKKLRRLALREIFPQLTKYSMLKNPPYKISFTFFSTSDLDSLTSTTISAYIIHCLEERLFQSSDSRVISKVEIKIRRILVKNKEGCLIEIYK